MDLEEGEIIIKIIHKHPVLFVVKTIFHILAALFVSLFLFFPALAGSASRLITFTASIVLLLIIIQFFISWTIFFFDVWVVTNKRIVDFELVRLFSRRISVVELEHVLSISVKVDGFFHTAISAGSLYIETAGRTEEFIIKDIKNPELAKELIYEAMREHRKRKEDRLADVLSSDNPEELANV